MSLLRLAAAFLRRDSRIAVSYRFPFLLGVLSILAALALFYYLGRLISPSAIESHSGFDRGYFAYAVLGLALLQIVQAGLISFSMKMRQEQTTGTFEALMSTPASPSGVILSSVTYDLIRSTVSSLFLIVLAIVVFGLRLDWSPDSLVAATGALAGCLVLFASLGIALAAFSVVFKQVTGLLAMVVTGLALLGGVYFPLDVLPEPLRSLGNILPFTWGLDTIRSALLNGTVDAPRLAGLVGSGLVAMPVALVLFGMALQRARRVGSLAQY